MNESWKQNVKLKGQIPENYILNECTFIKLKKYKSNNIVSAHIHL